MSGAACIFLKEDLCAVIYHSGGRNTRNNGQPHRTGGCFSCLGRKVRVYKVTLTVTVIPTPAASFYTQSILRVRYHF
ncbi:hypothetical protein QLX08_011131 [Tetragonisca angustula]|uniref:Uncharacterized protein n=1 Tax=Tetragonisca angustula TaxID=166442 RepID=A0AAW0Z9J1_9HYME